MRSRLIKVSPDDEITEQSEQLSRGSQLHKKKEWENVAHETVDNILQLLST